MIKAGLAREGFQVQPSLLRRKLLHRDPFDRLLLAQAEREGFLLITADALLARYPGPVRHQGSFSGVRRWSPFIAGMSLLGSA